MTNLQALQSTVSYSNIDANAFTRLLLDRGLTATDDYAGKSDADKTKAFELAKADLYVELITAANVSEGGYSISISERKNFLDYANGIYKKHGEVNPLAPTVTFLKVW